MAVVAYKVPFGGVVFAVALVLAMLSPAYAQSLSPAQPPAASDGTSIDQGIAYVLMLLALVLTKLFASSILLDWFCLFFFSQREFLHFLAEHAFTQRMKETVAFLLIEGRLRNAIEQIESFLSANRLSLRFIHGGNESGFSKTSELLQLV